MTETTIIESEGLQIDGVNVSVSLRVGELLAVVTARDKMERFSDQIEGLEPSKRGAVRFLDKDWRELSPSTAAEQRALIGRVFRGRAWVSNLDVDENIRLAQEYHTSRSVSEVNSEAVSLLKKFGVEEMPEGRPAWVDRAVLQSAQWARALLGKKRLLLLEDPLHGLAAAAVPECLAALREFLEGGGCAIWLCENRPRMESELGPENPRVNVLEI